MGEALSYISRKQSWLRFIFSFLLSAILAALLCLYFRGPRLGPLYDFLIRRRPAIPIAMEILIIDTLSPNQGFEITDNILEPSAVSSLLMTMSEFNAAILILQAPVLGISAGSTVREEEIRYRFEREFDTLNQNIRNLFDGIRTGSIAPGESALYVGELIELSERGKERLISTLINRDEEGIAQLERAAAIFGNVHHPGDLLVQLIGTVEEGRPGALADHGEYSRARPDRDGVLRRITPQSQTMEHIVYSALKNRYELYIPLDRDGALLFEVPRGSEDFRRISMQYFIDYDEADQSLRLLLEEAESYGIYSFIQGEENPIHLYDYALSIKTELLRGDIPLDHAEELKILWRWARNSYFDGLANFLYGPQGSMIDIFDELQIKHRQLLDLRTRLESNLTGSFCILGPPTVQGISDTEASALFANSIITGHAIIPGGELLSFLGSLICILLTAGFISFKNITRSLFYGFTLSIFSLLSFSLVFLFTGIWFDPLIPVAASGTFSLISIIWALILKSRFSRYFFSCYSPFIAPEGIKYLVRSGAPKPEELISLRAAVVAIRNPGINENLSDPKSAAAAILSFRTKLSRVIKRAGGMIAGNSGDLILACFGSPLERMISISQTGIVPKSTDNAIRAAGFISDLLRRKECRLWSFGMDFGLCAFTWSPLSGYSVFGIPVVKAKVFSNLGLRNNVRVLIGNAVTEALPEYSVKEQGVLKGNSNTGGEPYYELLL